MGLPVETALRTSAAIFAVVVHHVVLKRYEIDHLVLQLIALSWIAYCSLAYAVGFHLALTTALSFIITLTTTIVIYRAWFHPLRDFPGPWQLRISKFWAVWKTLDTKFQYYKSIYPELKKTYGDYVRTGPREISIFDTYAIQPILGFTSKTSKGPYYDVFEGSLQLTRDKAWHRQQRRVWDNGMKQSLTDYAPRVEEFTSELLDRIESSNGAPVPLNEFCVHYSYDVMSALVFNKSTGFTTGKSTEKAKRIVEILNGSLHGLGLIHHVPWFMKAISTPLSFFGPMKLWAEWTRDQLAARRAMKEPRQDFMSHLIEATPRSPEGDRLLFGETRLVISAGSDTIGTSLTLIFVQLGLHPEQVQGLRKELEEVDYSCMRPQPLLDAIINESMRLWPAVYFPSQRVTPPAGLQIPNGRFIPGNMIISIPAFALARDERNFAMPDEFIPERWTTRPELAMDKSAFLPFLTGPYVCAGKALAMMEMRSVVAQVVREYNIVLPSTFDEEEFFGRLEDHWTAGVPKQQVQFIKRKG